MIVLLARYYVMEGKVPAVLTALQRMKSEMKSYEPECVLYQAWLCPSPLKLGHYISRGRGSCNGEETTFRRRRIEAAAGD